MAHLARSVASLRIFGDDLIPEEVTNLLGCAPTNSYPKGFVQVMRSGRELVRKTGGWFLDASPAEPENLDGQVTELLSQLTSDMSIWSGLAQRFTLDLFCGWFMGGSNEGVSVAPNTLRALGERGIELSLDIYGPDDEPASTPAQPTVQPDGPASGGSAG